MKISEIHPIQKLFMAAFSLIGFIGLGSAIYRGFFITFDFGVIVGSCLGITFLFISWAHLHCAYIKIHKQMISVYTPKGLGYLKRDIQSSDVLCFELQDALITRPGGGTSPGKELYLRLQDGEKILVREANLHKIQSKLLSRIQNKVAG